MEYQRLGNTGLTVSRIRLGCMSYGDPAATVAGSTLRWEWALKEDEARPFFQRAIEQGINFFSLRQDAVFVDGLGGPGRWSTSRRRWGRSA